VSESAATHFAAFPKPFPTVLVTGDVRGTRARAAWKPKPTAVLARDLDEQGMRVRRLRRHLDQQGAHIHNFLIDGGNILPQGRGIWGNNGNNNGNNNNAENNADVNDIRFIDRTGNSPITIVRPQGNPSADHHWEWTPNSVNLKLRMGIEVIRRT
jgi:hypothetical protein